MKLDIDELFATELNSLRGEFNQLDPEERLLLIDRKAYSRSMPSCAYDSVDNSPLARIPYWVLAAEVVSDTGIGGESKITDAKVCDHHEKCSILLDWSCNYGLELGPENLKVCRSQEMTALNLGIIYSKIDSLRKGFEALTPKEKLAKINCQRSLESSYGYVFDVVSLPFYEMVNVIFTDTDIFNGTHVYDDFGHSVHYWNREFEKELVRWADIYGVEWVPQETWY